MTSRRGRWWRSLPLAAAALACAGVVIAHRSGPRLAGERLPGQIEPEAVPVICAPGGRVAAVLASPGQPVAAGQLLLRMEPSDLQTKLGRAIRALGPDSTAARTVSFLERVPLSTWAVLAKKDPERLAVEQEYVTALAGWEQTQSAAARTRLQRAMDRRKAIFDQPPIFTTDTLSAIRDAARAGAELTRWLDRQYASLEVRAPVSGVIEFLDLAPGDTIMPMSPAVLIDTAGRYTVTAPDGCGARALRPGTRVDVLLGSAQRTPAVVQSCDSGGLRATVVDPPVEPKAGEPVWILF